jgi:threonine/homoserine/homoserine lactone efflux protein
MDYLAPLAILAITQLLAAISPGQSFVLISKLALSSNRTVALSAAMGLGLGTIIWSSAAILGVALLLKSAAWAYTAFKIAGGLYLIWLAVMLWRHAPEPIEIDSTGRKLVSPARGFALGTVTQLANPKVVVFFGSIFVALVARSRARLGLRDSRRDRVPQRDRLVFGCGAGVLVRPATRRLYAVKSLDRPGDGRFPCADRAEADRNRMNIYGG